MSKLINDLGGYIAVAKALGLPPNQTWNWQSRGVPWRWRPAVAELAKKSKVKLPDNFIPLRPDHASAA